MKICVYEKRILRFEDVVFYNVDEIPFVGFPAILNIEYFGKIIKKYGNGNNEIKVERTRVEIETNAGKRIVEFSDCKFVKKLSKCQRATSGFTQAGVYARRNICANLEVCSPPEHL